MGNETLEPDSVQRRSSRRTKAENQKTKQKTKLEKLPVPEQTPEPVEGPKPVDLPDITITHEQHGKIRQAIMDSSRRDYEQLNRELELRKLTLSDGGEVPPAPPPVVSLPRNEAAPSQFPWSADNLNSNRYRLTSEEEKQLKEVESNRSYKRIFDEVERRLPKYVNDKNFMASVAERFFKKRENGLLTIALENMNLREIPEDKVDLAVRDRVAIALGKAGTPQYKLIFIESNIPGKKFISQLQSIEDFILVNYEWAKTVSPEHLAAASFHEKQHHVPDRLDLYRNILLSIISDEKGLKDEDKAMLVALGEIAHDRKTVQDLQRQYQGKGLIMLLDFFLQSLMMLQDPGPSFKIRIAALKREINSASLASK